MDFYLNILKELQILIQNMCELSFLWLVLVVLQGLKHWLSDGFLNYAFYNETLNYDNLGYCKTILIFKYDLN